MKRIARDLPHYISLIGIFGASFLGFVFFAYDRTFQMAIAIAAACGYVAWGIVHHYLHRDLYLVVVIEYLVFAFFGLVVVYSLLF